ncbi:MAG: GWxTD domain-containing protein [Candidatus Kryptoniota bacterium]
MGDVHFANNAPKFSSWIVNSSKDSVTVSFTYSVPFSKIIFIKHNGASEIDDVTFGANLTFSIDAADSITGINYHDLDLKKITVNNFEITQDPKIYADGIVTMTLPRSVFKVEAELTDDGQQITYLNEVRSENFAREKFSGILSVIFSDSLSGKDVYPNLHGNIARFPGNIDAVFLTEDTISTPMTLTLEANKKGSKSSPETISICKLDSLSPLKAALQPMEDSTNDSDHYSSIFFDIVPSSTHSLYIAKFDIDTLQEGTYTISVSLKGKSDKLHCSYLWLDKPFTLKNFPLALTLLKYIVPDSIFSYINSGNDEEQRDKFNEYWKSRNPNPKTAFNELEDKFYQRADYAYEHFKTISEDNGAATDRGKAYILFGKPAEVKREFRSDFTYEIWFYPNQKKSLIFREQGAGDDFRLYRTEDL